MSIDWDTLLYAPINTTFGVDGVFTLGDTAATTFTIMVLDMTSGAMTGGQIELSNMRPCADVRAVALADNGITSPQDDLLDALLTMSGKNWVIRDILPLPSPAGEDTGEYRLTLEEVTA